MILAAAIKYHIKDSNKDVVLCGARHGDIFKQMELLGLEPQKPNREMQGFIDHNGNFLNRKEALEHAHRCGQISSIIYDKKTNGQNFSELISEDLW